MTRSRPTAVCLVRSLSMMAIALTAGVCPAQPIEPQSLAEPAPAGSVALAESAADVGSYEQSMASAAQLEGKGDLIGAARALAAIQPAYPQDYELALRLANLHRAAGHSSDAERGYRLALQINPEGNEAALGLAWILLSRQRCGEALALLRPVLRRTPEQAIGHAEAAAAERACSAVYPVQVSAGLSVGAQLFPTVDYDVRAPSIALGARLDLRLFERVTLGLAYRGRVNTISFKDTNGEYLRGQHEVYADVGYHAPRFGVTLRYAFTGDIGGTGDRAHHPGLGLRVSPYGDGTLDLAASVYPDMKLLRGALAWYLPIYGGLGVAPGLAYQYTSLASAQMPTLNGAPLLSGALTVSFARPRYSLWLGAKYGNELRPAYLDLGIINNLPESIRYGAWAGGSVVLGQPGARGAYALRLSYALDYLEPLTPPTAAMQVCIPLPGAPPPPPGAPGPMLCRTVAGSNTVTGFTHAITLGLTRSF